MGVYSSFANDIALYPSPGRQFFLRLQYELGGDAIFRARHDRTCDKGARPALFAVPCPCLCSSRSPPAQGPADASAKDARRRKACLPRADYHGEALSPWARRTGWSG